MKKIMSKKIVLCAIGLISLVGCTSNDYVGNEELAALNNHTPITFSSGKNVITRADQTGDEAAATLNNNFVVFAYKTVGSATQTVFSNYQVNYVASSSNSTNSNSAGWEYVDYNNLPSAMSNYQGVAANTTNGVKQSIKYWDYSATNYKFFAYSLGKGKTGSTPTTYAKASLMTTSDTYELEGDANQLAACYLSDLKTITPQTSSTEVEMSFRSITSKITLGFYETIPGYSVKNLKFYPSSEGTSTTTPVLYAGSSVLPNTGTYTVTFDNNGKPQLAWTAATSGGTNASISFDATLANYANREYLEENVTNTYLGRSSNAATKTAEKILLPNPDGTPLTLKVDYTLLSRDGYGETIDVKGATAVVPAAYTQWKPGYAYTYLFKISDNTNGSTGGTTVGLYPITLDAVVTADNIGNQETITTVGENSITTYAKGQVVTANDEYQAGNIYVVVGDGTTALTIGNNAKLYTVTQSDTDGTDGITSPAQEITESSVANALANGSQDPNGTWSVTDVNKFKLSVTTASGLEKFTSIPADDAPHGTELTINGAKFTATAGTTYVFEYINGTNKYYKVIKVKAN